MRTKRGNNLKKAVNRMKRYGTERTTEKARKILVLNTKINNLNKVIKKARRNRAIFFTLFILTLGAGLLFASAINSIGAIIVGVTLIFLSGIPYSITQYCEEFLFDKEDKLAGTLKAKEEIFSSLSPYEEEKVYEILEDFASEKL